MGNQTNYTKDPNVDIYIKLNKQSYKTGQQVQGQIIINIKKITHLYQALYLKLSCIENYQFNKNNKGQGTKRSVETYMDQVIIHRFDSGIDVGVYSFPFSFIAPISLPGSLLISQYENITYKLIAYLASYEQKTSIQYDQINLNLQESLRSQMSEIQVSSTFASGFIFSKNYTVFLTCNKNAVSTGQRIKLTGIIDNSTNDQDIQDISFVFKQTTINYVNKYKIYPEIVNDIPFFEKINLVKAFERKEFEVTLTIPQIRQNTAIGQYICQCHQITIRIPKSCCFYNQLDMFLLVQQHSYYTFPHHKSMPYFNPNMIKTMPKISYSSLAPHSGPSGMFPFINPPVDIRSSNFIQNHMPVFEITGKVNNNNNFNKKKIQQQHGNNMYENNVQGGYPHGNMPTYNMHANNLLNNNQNFAYYGNHDSMERIKQQPVEINQKSKYFSNQTQSTPQTNNNKRKYFNPNSKEALENLNKDEGFKYFSNNTNQGTEQ